MNGTWNVQVNDVNALGKPSRGKVRVKKIKFNSAPGMYDPVAPPTQLGTSTVAYADNKVILQVKQTDPAEAWAFELDF
jgi:hypothetical protein